MILVSDAKCGKPVAGWTEMKISGGKLLVGGNPGIVAVRFRGPHDGDKGMILLNGEQAKEFAAMLLNAAQKAEG